MPNVTPQERSQLPPEEPKESTVTTADTTDESEGEEDEEIEEDSTLEARRLWLLRRIQQCDQAKTELTTKLEKEVEPPKVELPVEESCSRACPYRAKRRARPLKFCRIETRSKGHDDEKLIRRLDDSYHHVLSTPRSVPLSVRLASVMHEMDPSNQLELTWGGRKGGYGGSGSREKKRKKDKKREVGDSLNQIVVPPSSLVTSIEMPKYKNIDVPGYRSDETSDSTKEDGDEDISHAAYVKRHIKAEKAEKMRYYQSAIANCRKRKKQQLDPRIASPTEESYIIREAGCRVGYKKLTYPISPSRIGELGYHHHHADHQAPKKKKQKKQEWRSSTTEGSGGLRLKLSLRKL